MSLFLILKYLHILLFVFWLGMDMGTYYSSRFVIDPKLSAPQRATALQILLGCDLGPRVAMPLIMPTGIHMASLMGLIEISSIGMGFIWIASIFWLGLVLKIHFGKEEVLKKKLQNFDYWLRIFIVICVSGIAIYSLFQPDYILATWLSWKLLIVCGMILCGLGIRYHLGKFKPEFGKLMTGNESDETNNALKKSMDDCMPYVYGIWIGLLVNAALGVHLI